MMQPCTTMTNFDVCDAIGVDPGHVHTYYQWLLEHHGMGINIGSNLDTFATFLH
eukprot:SAG31_NODE_1640_length_7666_cov_11.488437_3_plen_54_part_00